jgi:hypothetical protein
MASPGAIGGFSIGSTLVGGILSGIGKKDSYDAQALMYNYQAQVAKINSDIDKQNADYAINKGEMQAQTEGLKAAQQMGQIKVGQAASGFDVNTGSNLAVQQGQRLVAGIDLATIRSNASKVAYDYNVKSVEDINQAGLDTMAASNASQAGDLALASSLVSTAGSVSSKWLQASQSGMFNSGSGGGIGSA